MIAHSLTPTQWALHEAKKARQARQAQMASRVKANDNEPARVDRDPLWMRYVLRFDAHVVDYHLFVAKFASPRRAFLMLRAEAKGYTMTQITTPTRIRSVVIDRQDLMLEVGEEFPEMSLNEIGRLFGGYDHSTVHNAMQRAALRRAGLVDQKKWPAPKPKINRVQQPARNRVPEEIRDQVVAMWKRGHRDKRKIGQKFGITGVTVLSILRQRGEVE